MISSHDHTRLCERQVRLEVAYPGSKSILRTTVLINAEVNDYATTATDADRIFQLFTQFDQTDTKYDCDHTISSVISQKDSHLFSPSGWDYNQVPRISSNRQS
jgi:hypothetical protein